MEVPFRVTVWVTVAEMSASRIVKRVLKSQNSLTVRDAYTARVPGSGAWVGAAGVRRLCAG